MFLVLVPIGLYVFMCVGRMMKRGHVPATRTHVHHLQDSAGDVSGHQGQSRHSPANPKNAGTSAARPRSTTTRPCGSSIWTRLWGRSSRYWACLAWALALLAGAYLVVKKETHLFGIPMTEQPIEAEALLTLYGLLAAISRSSAQAVECVHAHPGLHGRGGSLSSSYLGRRGKVTANLPQGTPAGPPSRKH